MGTRTSSSAAGSSASASSSSSSAGGQQLPTPPAYAASIPPPVVPGAHWNQYAPPDLQATLPVLPTEASSLMTAVDALAAVDPTSVLQPNLAYPGCVVAQLTGGPGQPPVSWCGELGASLACLASPEACLDNVVRGGLSKLQPILGA